MPSKGSSLPGAPAPPGHDDQEGRDPASHPGLPGRREGSPRVSWGMTSLEGVVSLDRCHRGLCPDGLCPGGRCWWMDAVPGGGVSRWGGVPGPTSRLPCRSGAAQAGGPPRAGRVPGCAVRGSTSPRRSAPPAAATRWRRCAWEAAGPDGAAGAGRGAGAAAAGVLGLCPRDGCSAEASAGGLCRGSSGLVARPAAFLAAAPARRYRSAGSRGGLPQGRAGTRPLF